MVKSLKDHIKEAKTSSAYPLQVIEIIEKDKTLAAGHSGAIFSELIETLLSIPWKKIKPIKVRVQDFEEGLHRTHYGWDRPKEIVCDFFTNLIRRYRQLNPLRPEVHANHGGYRSEQLPLHSDRQYAGNRTTSRSQPR